MENVPIASAHVIVSTAQGLFDLSSTIVRQIHVLQPRGLDPNVDRGTGVL